MKEHLKRKFDIFKDALPDEGTTAYIAMLRTHEDRLKKNPAFEKELQKRFDQAVSTWQVQHVNGLGYGVDEELRHYLDEFNHRSWSYGLRKMPVMFNVMEAYFNLDKNLNLWKLLDEEYYEFSFYDFLDYYTSCDVVFNADAIRENFTEDLIYNYNVTREIEKITFRTDDGKTFVVAGISVVRRGDEVTFMFLAGEVTDTIRETAELAPVGEDRAPGKEMIELAADRKREAVVLNDNSSWWKTLVVCRFDIADQTIDARYVARDEGNTYSILTDDPTGFVNGKTWLSASSKSTFEAVLKSIEAYGSLFELAKIVLHLPEYFNTYEDDLNETICATDIKSLISNPLRRKKYFDVDDQYKVRSRSVWSLDRKVTFLADKLKLKDELFRFESKGYWKQLDADELGADKKGKVILGRTWVSVTESYFVAANQELVIGKGDDTKLVGENSGIIYVMRNAVFEKNVFKIGLTTKGALERAGQLSKTSVPDNFFVMREWQVQDCVLAEKEIHELLKVYRVDPRREFFKLEMKYINEVVDSVVQRINGEIR